MVPILFAILLCFSAIATSIHISKNTSEALSKNFIISINHDTEWFDGNFQGVWGRNNNYSSGTIMGNLNLGRTSSMGTFYGDLYRYTDNSSGTVKGIFRNRFLLGLLKNNEGSTTLFIGTITGNETDFSAILFNPRHSLIHIRGKYNASFLPPLTGSYSIGVKSLHLIDTNRSEEFTPDDPDDYREMMIQVWYPTDTNDVGVQTNYMDAPTFAWLKDRSPVPLITIPNHAYQYVRPYGKKNVSIYNGEPYPVIIFSPGYNGVYQIYTSLIEDIVSHGFIVVSINHPYISGITVFPDGRTINVSQDPPGNLSLRSVVEDAKFVLDTITEMNNSDPDFNGRFDLSRIGMYGHSYGGASTSICCYEDDRFQCGLTLDGVFYIDLIPDGLKQPFLLLIADNRFNDDNVQSMWNKLNGTAYKVQINGSTHYGFTDVGVLLNHLVPIIPPRWLGFGTIEPKRHVNITRTIERMFFEVFLNNRPMEDLTHLLSTYDEVQFELK
jgi:hypothetical protein